MYDEEEEEEDEEEGFNEGLDSVLTEKKEDDINAMDTIARYVTHPYYLRSLHIPEIHPSQGIIINILLYVIQYYYTDTVSSYERYEIPRLSLPCPPTPRGNTATDYWESLDARDTEIRKCMCVCMYV